MFFCAFSLRVIVELGKTCTVSMHDVSPRTLLSQCAQPRWPRLRCPIPCPRSPCSFCSLQQLVRLVLFGFVRFRLRFGWYSDVQHRAQALSRCGTRTKRCCLLYVIGYFVHSFIHCYCPLQYGVFAAALSLVFIFLASFALHISLHNGEVTTRADKEWDGFMDAGQRAQFSNDKTAYERVAKRNGTVCISFQPSVVVFI